VTEREYADVLADALHVEVRRGAPDEREERFCDLHEGSCEVSSPASARRNKAAPATRTEKEVPVPANRRNRFALALWLGLALAGSSVVAVEAAAQQKKAVPTKKEKQVSSKPRDYGKTLAVLKTSQGDVTIRFLLDKAPGHVKNFVDLAAARFYDGTLFHRVIPDFMIQGGDPLTKDPSQAEVCGTGGNTDRFGKPLNVKAEFNDVSHRRGVVSMARASDPDSASSQFFIVVKDSPFLDRQYTVFGEVVKGMDVVDRIVSESNSDTADPRSGGRPRAYQRILKVELVQQAPDPA
jgi:peptidyl-prolyl cis-trans isomerase B (cyclophilin B)